MQERLIMKELAKKLNTDGGGNCPYDPGCAYGFGKSCMAEEPVLKRKFEEIKNEPDPDKGFTPGVFMDGGTEGTWPCSNCIEITFSEPGK